MSAEPHDFVLSVLIPVTRGELERLSERRRVVFRKVDVQDPTQVRGWGVFCARCQIPAEKMGWGELDDCRGEPA